MRIATMVALFYLPANLVVAFFSTSLVDITQGNSGIRIYIHREIWIAILSVLALTSFTFFPTVYWGRKGKQHSQHATA